MVSRIFNAPIVPRQICISHLFFADDSLILFKADREGCINVKEVLKRFEIASGQMINFEKSGVALSPNCKQGDVERIVESLGIQAVQGHSLYLGLPTFSTRQKRLQFGYLAERVQKKLWGWKEKNFSAGGKEVLIKAVIQAIPTYTMSCFRIPDSICCDINRMCAGFWWGDEETKKRMHWMKWNELCRPKQLGGMGFRDLTSFNKALLAKQIWRMIKNPDSLVAKVFKARYFRNGDVMNGKVTSASSFVWRSLCWGRTVLQKGVRWRVGNGENIRVFSDAWITDTHTCILSKRQVTGNEEMRVSELITVNKEWNEEVLDVVCVPHEKELVRRVPIGERSQVDERMWRFDENGKYTVRGGYLAKIGFYYPNPNSSCNDRKRWSKLVWAISVPPKVKIFWWRALNNVIPTELNLLRHYVPTTGLCGLCKCKQASSEHSLLFCDKIKMVWKNSDWWKLLKRCREMYLIDICYLMRKELDDEAYEVWVVLIWMVWGYVCRMQHEEGGEDRAVSVLKARLFWTAHQQARPTFTPAAALGMVPGNRNWVAPRKGRLRADVDALFDREGGVFGVGVIVRDELNHIKLAISRRVAPSSSVVGAELKAVVHAIIACVKEKLGPIEIFTDSFTLARVLANPEEAEELLPDEIRDIMEDTRDVLVVGIFHAYRSAIRAAHYLAQFAKNISSPCVWTTDFPDWLREIVSSDFS